MFPSQNYKMFYLCETMENRIIRIVQDDMGRYRSSVFWQGSGRMGPSSIESRNSIIYVALYDLKTHAKDGVIIMLNSDGVETGKIIIPNAPEIV
mmetsp:Transcript_23560/g.3887  ORF Transcript_23560/g.3887 Transcript_23560/m.3887 type:complete len:94 (+) Transcript_23560:473-754(+)